MRRKDAGETVEEDEDEEEGAEPPVMPEFDEADVLKKFDN